MAAIRLLYAAESPEPIDLKPVLGDWPFASMGSDWMLPKGRQVLDGVPFQIDGAILLNASNSVQRSRPGKFKVEHIAVGRRFEKLHLLAATDFGVKEGVQVGIIRLQYADGSDDTITIKSGEHVAAWLAPWHKAQDNTAETKTSVAWVGQHSSAAQSDKFFCFFHLTLQNPHPDKQVTELSLESPKTQAGLITIAITTGPAEAERLGDTVAATKSPFPDLRPRSGESVAGRGIVKTLAGQPLPGARVRVMAVRPFDTSDGNSATTGPEVGLEAFTDADGRFTVPPLPDNRLYRLLAAADGFQLGWYRGLDPKSDPVEVRLKPLDSKQGKFAARGKLVGLDGQAVPWAMIEVDGVGNGMGTSWGSATGFPSELASGTNGDFVLSRDTPFTRVQLRINAPGFAPQMLWLDATNQITTVSLGPGFVIRGRLLKDGQPLVGLRVGICGTPRWSEVFAGHFETTSGSNGVFTFEHVTTNTAWFFYGVLSSFKNHGALPPRSLQSGDHNETNDLGDIEIQPGLRLAGKVVTRDGSALPKNTKIRISSDQAWDSLVADVAKDGGFAAENVYGGPLEIYLENRDWRLAAANRSLDIHNPYQLTGVLETNKDDLVIAIEQGQRQYNYSGSGNGNLPQQDWPQSRPLAGVEPGGPPPIILAGQVVDDKTGDQIKRFKLVPGYKPPVQAGMTPPKKPLLQQMLQPFSKKGISWQEMPFWQYPRTEELSNGTFRVEFARLSSTPLLRIEAQGYEPAETEPININTTNLVVRLKPGLGPGGIVLLANGQPAAGATVLYLALQEQCSLSGAQLSMYGNSKDGQRTTGADGKFSFPVRAHGSMLYVSHSSGWAEESVDRISGGLTLKLQPWATLNGTLVMNSNNTPAPNIDLTVNISSDWQKGEPHINVQGRTKTDAAGNFYFVDVPPRRVEISRIIPMSSGGWQNRVQTWLVAQPGGSNNVGNVIFDQPPPPSLAEQVKQKLGL